MVSEEGLRFANGVYVERKRGGIGIQLAKDSSVEKRCLNRMTQVLLCVLNDMTVE